LSKQLEAWIEKTKLDIWHAWSVWTRFTLTINWNIVIGLTNQASMMIHSHCMTVQSCFTPSVHNRWTLTKNIDLNRKKLPLCFLFKFQEKERSRNETTMAEEENNGGENDDVDRLSNLPDSLLCHILSFLPTKTTVQTTPLISRHFRNLWKTLQTFDFDDEYEFNGKTEDENTEHFMFFSIFVNAVLAQRESRRIRKFRLSCCHFHEDVFYTSSIDTWVRTAIGPYLEEFYISLCNYDDGFNLPLTLLSCSNLVFLR